MDNFLITLTTVALMLAYAAPGFLVVKTKLIKEESISAFAFVLMYICQPCLVIYSFNQVPRVICQRLQNSCIDFEKNGRLKFSSSLTPNNSETPLTISMHPLKSAYICNVYKSIPTISNIPP